MDGTDVEQAAAAESRHSFSLNPQSSRGFQAAAGAALVVAVALASAGWFFARPSMTQDELTLLIYPDLINHGRVPNRDFFTPYGPGTFWPLAGAFRIFGGPSVGVERIVGALYHVLVALGVWALVRNRGRWLAVAAGSLSALLAGGLLLLAFGWLAALASLVWSMAAAQSRRWAVAGVLGAVAVTTRPEFIVVVAVLAAIQLDGWRPASRFVFGFLIGAIPLLIHLTMVGSTLPTNVFLDRVGVNARFPFTGRSPGLVAALALLVLSVCVLLAAAIRRKRRSEAAWAALAVLLLPQTLQRFDKDHVLYVAIAVTPLAAAIVGQKLAGTVSPVTLRWGPRALVLACSVIVATGAFLAGVAPRGSPVTVGDRTLITRGDSSSAAIRRAALEIDRSTPIGQDVLVGLKDNRRFGITASYFYYLLPNRVPDAYYLELAPGITEERGSGLIGDFRDAQMLVLTDFPPTQSRALYPYLRPGSTRVDEYVDRHFCDVSTAAGFEILRRCRNDVGA
jgi:hypothetical protein